MANHNERSRRSKRKSSKVPNKEKKEAEGMERADSKTEAMK